MRRFVRTVLALGIMVSASTPAFAEEPYYFHKTGVARPVYVEDVNYCAGLSGAVRSPDYNSSYYSSNTTALVVGSVMTAFFSTLMERKARRRLVSRIERTCMGDKGYERRAIDNSAHRAILDLQGDAKIDRMFALVSSANPTGKVLVE